MANRLDVVQLLVEKGKVNLESKAENGRTPMAMAAQMGNAKVVNYLFSKGADADVIGNERQTPLFVASSLGLVDMVR